MSINILPSSRFSLFTDLFCWWSIHIICCEETWLGLIGLLFLEMILLIWYSVTISDNAVLLLGAQQSDSVVHTCRSVAQSCLSLLWPLGCARQAPLSMGFPRPEHCSGLPFPSPGDLPDQGESHVSSIGQRILCHRLTRETHTYIRVSVCVCETQGERIFFRFFSYIGYHKRWYRQLSDGYLTVSYNWLLYHQSSSLIICLIMYVH